MRIDERDVEVVIEAVAPELSVADLIRQYEERGPWVPGCGGSEVPFTTRTGRRLLYCYQPSSGRHAYLDMGSDLILTDEEARLALDTY